MSIEGNDNNYFLGADNPGPTTVVQGKITPQSAEATGNGGNIMLLEKIILF